MSKKDSQGEEHGGSRYWVKSFEYKDEDVMAVTIMAVMFQPRKGSALAYSGYRSDHYTMFVRMTVGDLMATTKPRRFANAIAGENDDTLKSFLVALDATAGVWDGIEDGGTYTKTGIEDEFGEMLDLFR